MSNREEWALFGISGASGRLQGLGTSGRLRHYYRSYGPDRAVCASPFVSYTINKPVTACPHDLSAETNVQVEASA